MANYGRIAIVKDDDVDIFERTINRFIEEGYFITRRVRTYKRRGKLYWWCVMATLPEQGGK